ncbi:hypothetical protein [Pseudoalteromonas rubra]|uniref:Uncharacterized protein n=1 Tax=Pseudoalteromonas rubra TaxID=43658 RepID=A0A0U3HTG4_9GAMM|nr:hypothetical protein [Pseudoalteromonas rubra]ALU44248.1 hypothetical protein AT705_15575 [Pseudoalteromonas rubra]
MKYSYFLFLVTALGLPFCATANSKAAAEDLLKPLTCAVTEANIACSIALFKLNAMALKHVPLTASKSIELSSALQLSAIEHLVSGNIRQVPGSVVSFETLDISGEGHAMQHALAFKDMHFSHKPPSNTQFYARRYNNPLPTSPENLRQLAALDMSIEELNWRINTPKSNVHVTATGVKQNAKQVSKPGSYQNVTIKPNSSWHITPGTFHLMSLNAGENTKIIIENNPENTNHTVLYVHGDLETLPVIDNRTHGALAIIYLGSTDITLSHPFNGVWFSPDAHLTLTTLPDNMLQVGQFRAKSIQVEAGVHIQHYPFDLFSLIPAELVAEAEDLNPQSELSAINYSSVQLEQMIEAHLNNLFGMGEEANQQYAKSLETLRKNAHLVVPELFKIYDDTALTVEGQMRRWSAVHILSELNSPLANNKLYEIAISKPDYTFAPNISSDHTHGPSYESRELSIRAAAMDGIANLAALGYTQSDETLANYILGPQDKEPMTLRYAIKGYLKGNDTEVRREQLLRHLGPEYRAFIQGE